MDETTLTKNRHIVLNAGRVSQVEHLARIRKTTIAGAVESLVADRVTAGELPAGFPSFLVERRSGDVLITLDGVKLAPIPVANAIQLGTDFADLAMKTAGAVTLRLPDGSELTTRRNGLGFTIAAGAARIAVSTLMLAEIAQQLQETSR